MDSACSDAVGPVDQFCGKTLFGDTWEGCGEDMEVIIGEFSGVEADDGEEAETALFIQSF